MSLKKLLCMMTYTWYRYPVPYEMERASGSRRGWGRGRGGEVMFIAEMVNS